MGHNYSILFLIILIRVEHQIGKRSN